MRCRDCGHDNPDKNQFCGMCGGSLADKTAGKQAVEKTPPNLLWEPVTTPLSQEPTPFPPEEIETRRGPIKAEPVEVAPPVQPGRRNDKWWVDERETTVGETRRESLKAEPVEVAPPAEPARRSDKWWVDEGETTVGGPSFLGLSNAETGGGSSSSSGYSYLFQEEPERSHKGLWVFLLLVAVLGGVVYAKWQPIRDYVLTKAIAHSRPKPPAAPENNTTATNLPGSSEPTTTLATSDAQAAPTITTAEKQPEKAQGGLPEGDKKSAAGAGKSEEGARPAAKNPPNGAAEHPADAAPKEKGAKSDTAAKDGASADAGEEEASAANEEKPSPAKAKRLAAPANAGSELVITGERYLYGRGVPRNCNQAVSYFNAAAAKQNPQAYSHLGALYATGECVPMDRAAAYAWFRRAYAKEPSNHYFEQNLSMLWREMSLDERQRAMARQ